MTLQDQHTNSTQALMSDSKICGQLLAEAEEGSQFKGGYLAEKKNFLW